MKFFARLVKIDEEKRIVIGRATQEVADKADEILDYESSKPQFEKWSSEIEKASKGKSKGNVREMHGNKVAGTVQQLLFQDTEKAIDLHVKVVADDAWKMVKEGGYTGFSIGGSYLRKWTDPDNPELTRFTPRVVEVSLVDNPCVPTATFEAIKADGTVEMRKFKSREEAQETMEPKQVWQAADGAVFATKAEALAHDELTPTQKAANDAFTKLDAALGKKEEEKEKDKEEEAEDQDKDTPEEEDKEDETKKREFSTDEREKAADTGAAMPDGSYPIKTKEDLKNAIQAFGRAKNKAKVKAHIRSRAKSLGAEDMLPESWGKSKKALIADMKKSMAEACDVARATDALMTLEMLLLGEESEDEEDAEQMADLEEAIDRLKSFISSEIMEGKATPSEELQKFVAATPELEKFKDDLLKAGARHSKGDAEHLKGMSKALHKMQDQHDAMGDHLMDMHKCMKGLGMPGHEMGDEEEMPQKMAKLTASNAAMSEMLEKAVKTIEGIPAILADKDKELDELAKRLEKVEGTPVERKSRASYSVIKGEPEKDPETQSYFQPNGMSPREARANY